MKIWQKDEVKFFLKNINKMTTDELASYLKRPTGSIVMFKRKYKLLKDNEYSLTIANMMIGENSLRAQILNK